MIRTIEEELDSLNAGIGNTTARIRGRMLVPHELPHVMRQTTRILASIKLLVDCVGVAAVHTRFENDEQRALFVSTFSQLSKLGDKG